MFFPTGERMGSKFVAIYLGDNLLKALYQNETS
jgi:hypothetical protein